MKAAVIRTDGTYTVQEVESEWGAISAIVGGWIEHVMLYPEGSREGSMFINEEGKLKGMAYNEVATSLFKMKRGNWDYIVGDAVVFGGSDENGDETDITDQLLQLIDLNGGINQNA